MYRHGRHHRQHIYQQTGGPPEQDRLVATCMTEQDSERIVLALNLYEREAVVDGALSAMDGQGGEG